MPDLWMRWGSSHFFSFISCSFWVGGLGVKIFCSQSWCTDGAQQDPNIMTKSQNFLSTVNKLDNKHFMLGMPFFLSVSLSFFLSFFLSACLSFFLSFFLSNFPPAFYLFQGCVDRHTFFFGSACITSTHVPGLFLAMFLNELYDQFYFRLINDFLWQVLRIDISTITADRSVVDSALHVCFSSSSLKQLLVITSTSRLMKLDSHNGLLLSEVGTYSSLQFNVENNMGLHRFYFTLNCD